MRRTLHRILREFLRTGCCALLASVTLVEPVQAAAWDSVLTQVIVILTSGWARGVAIIAIVLSGLGMMVNLFDRRTAIFIVLGVILVFGAPSIVDLLIDAASEG